MAAVLFGMMVALGIFELGFRTYYSFHQNYDYEMWKYARYLKMPVDDARGHVHVPNASMRLMGVNVRINSKGLRDREIPYKRSPHSRRILAVGDSFTLGWGVRASQTFPKLLEKKLGVEVINAGIGNYNTAQELAAYRIEYSKYDPDVVLLGFYVNDAEPAQDHNWPGIFRRFCVFGILDQLFNRARIYFRPELRYGRYYNAQFQGESWEHFKKTVQAFASAVAANHSRFAAVLLPDLRNLKHDPFSAVYAKVGTQFSADGAFVIDARTPFLGRNSKEYWVAPDDPHPNARANRMIADVISREVSKGGFWHAR